METELSSRAARRARRRQPNDGADPEATTAEAQPAPVGPSQEETETTAVGPRRSRRQRLDAELELPTEEADQASAGGARDDRAGRRQRKLRFEEPATGEDAPARPGPGRASFVAQPMPMQAAAMPRSLLGEEPEPDDVFTTTSASARESSSRESSRGSSRGAKMPAGPSVGGSGNVPLPPIGGTFTQGRDGTFRCLPAQAPRGGGLRSGSLRSVGGGGGGSRGGANSVPLSGGGSADADTVNLGWQPPPTCDAVLASLALYGVLAPAVLAQGLLAGLSLFEMLTMDAPIDTPPNARVLYARSSTSFWRAHMMLGMASLVGSIVRALPRMRSGQYVLQPWRRVLDRASIFLYVACLVLSFSVRQLAWALDSQVTVDHLPFYDPVSSPYFQTIFEGWRSSGPVIYSARALCCWLGLLIAIYPTGDHRHRPELNRAAAAAAAAAPPHVLSPSEAELTQAGIAFSIACWRFGTPTIRAQPLPRSPDGGLPMLPVPERRITALASFANQAAFRSGMDRRLFSSRLMRIVLMLGLDLLVEMTADTIHWLLHVQLNLVRGKPMWDIVVFDAITFALTLFCRATVNITFFSMCVSTAYYKLGRIDRLRESYGRLMVLQCAFFVSGIGMRAHRIINDFRGLTTGDTELFLWDVWQKGDYEMHKREWDYAGKDIKNNGLIYSLHKGLTLLLLLPYCAWTFDCARRLGRSEYYLHPDLESELSRR